MSHSRTEIDLTQFDHCLILGKKKNNDQESNATGKSTIFKGIDYILFNKIAADTLEEIVRDGQDQCEGILEFELHGKDWQVSRKRSNKSKKSHVLLKEWFNNKWDTREQRTSAQTEKVLKELLGISYTAFTNSVLFEQGKFSEIAEATDTQRRNLLKEPLSLSIYGVYEKISKVKLKEFDKDFQEKKILIGALGDPAADIIVLNKQLKAVEKEVDQLEKERTNLRKQIQDDRHKVSELEKLLSSDAAKIADQLVELDKQKQACEVKLARLQKQALEYKTDIDKCNTEHTKLESLLKGFQDEQKKLQKIKVRSDSEISKDLDEVDKKERKGQLWVATLQADYDKYSKPLPSGYECEVCFNELSDEYREKVTLLNKEKSISIEKNLTTSQEKLNKLARKRAALNQERKDIEEHARKLNRVGTNIDSIQVQIQNNRKSFSTLEKLAKQLLDDAKEETSTLNDITKKEKNLQKQSKDFNVSEVNDEIVALRHSIRDNEVKENNVIDLLSNKSTEKGIANERRRKRETDVQELAKLQTEHDELEAKVRLWTRVVKAFSTSGIPTLIIHTILDDIQVEANNILQELRPELSLQFSIEKNNKDALDIIYKVNGNKRNYKLLSGGQKAFISFALRLGLSVVIQKRLNVSIKFLELDEVDQPMDEAGQDAFVQAIRKFSNRYKILVITHNNRLKDKFKHIIQVEHDEKNGSVGRLITQ